VALITRETSPQVTRESRGGRLVALTLLGLLVLAGLGYVALAWFTSGKIPHGTSVEGIGIGALTPTAAEQRLRDRLSDRSNRPLVLTWHGRVFRVDPGRAGMSIDYGATVQKAGGTFSLDPSRLWHYFTGGEDITAVVSVVDPSMAAQLAPIAEAVDRKPVEGSITFHDGTAHPVYSRAGRALDQAATRELLVHQFLHGGRGGLPVGPDEPYVSADAVRLAMRDFAEPAMLAPVVLVVGGQAIIATPQEYSDALSMVPSGHRLKPVVDGRRLLRGIRPAMTTVGDTPRDARIVLVDGRPQIIPARIGATFDVEDLAARFPTYAAKPPGERKMEVKAVVQQPRFSTADARALGVEHVVAQATAGLPADGAETAAATARSLDARLLRPHQVLTVSAPVGVPDSGPAAAASSVVASTLYSAAFAAGLEVDRRTSLPTYDGDFALGIDARVDGDHILRLRDNTPYGVLVDASVRSGRVTVRLWSTRHWDVTTSTSRRRDVVASPVTYDDSAGCRPTTGTEGFAVTVTRVLRTDGQVVVGHAFPSTYHATGTVVCQARPQPSADSGTSPAPTPTPPGQGHGHGNGHGNGHGHGPPH
jgi:hypothetical protein